MAQQLTLRVKNSFADIPAANAAVSRWLGEHQASPAADYFANLAIEEIVTNCIKYGYDDAAEHSIQIDLELSARRLTVTVTDDGHPFNLLELPTPDTTQPVEDRSIGGLGIHLLRKMADQIEYVRTAGRNRVTLQKTLGGGAGTA